MAATKTHHDLSITRAKHVERAALIPRYPIIEGQLAGAYHSMQLTWISRVPGYREAVRRKVAEAARNAEKKARRIELTQHTLHDSTLAQVLRDEQLERLTGY